jgi:hypothetical protein
MKEIHAFIKLFYMRKTLCTQITKICIVSSQHRNIIPDEWKIPIQWNFYLDLLWITNVLWTNRTKNTHFQKCLPYFNVTPLWRKTGNFEPCSTTVFQCEIKLNMVTLIYETLLVSKLLTFNNAFSYDIIHYVRRPGISLLTYIYQ